MIVTIKKNTLMKIEESVKKRIIRNIFLSLFIYALPILLMFFTFYFTGQRPWLKKTTKVGQVIKP